MATTSEVNGWAEITLRSAEALIEDIHERAPDWDERPEGERADFTLEWEAIVQRIEDAVADDQDGTLRSDLADRLRELARELVRSREVIVGIGLDYPDLGHLLADVPLLPDERIDHYLTSLNRWAGRLRMMGDFWDSPLLDRRERQAFTLEWNNIIGRFATMEALARSGALKAESREELRQVAEYLAELLPTMRRLGVRLPDLDALERARSVEAA